MFVFLCRRIGGWLVRKVSEAGCAWPVFYFQTMLKASWVSRISLRLKMGDVLARAHLTSSGSQPVAQGPPSESEVLVGHGFKFCIGQRSQDLRATGQVDGQF